MTSHRKRKRDAKQRDMSVRELELCDLLEEVLERVRWLQILGYSNQFLLDRHAKVTEEERDKVLEAAVRAVDKDRAIGRWHERLGRIKAETTQVRRAMRRAQKDIAQGRPAPIPPAERSTDGASE